MAKLATYGALARGPTAYGRGAWPRPRRGSETRLPYRPAALRDETPTLGETGAGIVQGLRASDLEARVYRALRALGWTDESVDFQYPIRGGFRPGGQVLDFVVAGWGRTVVIAVDGDYWHNRTLQQREADREQQQAAESWFRGPVTFIKLNSGDLLDDAQALRRLAVEVGFGR